MNGIGALRHIAIEGAIGVGKSSLARRLGNHLGAELMMEAADENPLLERFYADQPGYAFQTQLIFLFQRLKQMQSLAQPGMFSATVVSDFVFAKDDENMPGWATLCTCFRRWNKKISWV